MPHLKKILLADNSEEFCALVQEYLQKHGNFHVSCAKDSCETMDSIHQHRPHLLLLDSMLPHKGGLHLLQQLQKHSHPVTTFFMTALPTQRVVQDALKLGATVVFPKPFSMHALTEQIHIALNRVSHPKHKHDQLDGVILIFVLSCILE